MLCLLAIGVAEQGACQDPDPPRPAPTPVEEQEARARRIRAVFLRHFCQLVTWPEEALGKEDEAFVIGIVGADPLQSELDDVMRDREIEGHRVLIRRLGRFEALDGIEELRSCHVLLVAESDPVVQGRIIGAVTERPILLVSDERGFADAGGGIQTFVKDNKPRFEVNRRALRRAGLRPSSKLLKLSRSGPPRQDAEDGGEIGG